MIHDIRTFHLRRIQTELGKLAYELTKVNFSQFYSGEAWAPAINVYRCTDSVKICVDLAGVQKSAIEVQVQPGRLVIRGQRPPPEPLDTGCQMRQVLAMEIDYGPFERRVILPPECAAESVTAKQSNGLLWIDLPLREES
jgi:HSP20 family molecular chaperone IbpA